MAEWNDCVCIGGKFRIRFMHGMDIRVTPVSFDSIFLIAFVHVGR